MNLDDVWQAIDAERSGLADLLDELSPSEWETPSLCDGWRVREVAAHLTLSQNPVLATTFSLLRARGDVNRMISDTARRRAALPTAEYSRLLRGMLGSRRKIVFVTAMAPLIDVLVHGQDIAVPLGRARAMPPTVAAAAATDVWSRSWPFNARRRLRGLRLVATDTAWSVGDGASVEGPIGALLLLLTGREAALGRLTGDGVRRLTAGARPHDPERGTQ